MSFHDEPIVLTISINVVHSLSGGSKSFSLDDGIKEAQAEVGKRMRTCIESDRKISLVIGHKQQDEGF